VYGTLESFRVWFGCQTVARHQRGLYKIPSSITVFWTTDVIFGQPMWLLLICAKHLFGAANDGKSPDH
jgi:hypothetical protein